MSILTRDDLSRRLLALLEELAAAEREALRLQFLVTQAKEDLADFEARTVLAGVPGANADQRGAFIREASTGHRQVLQATQETAQAAAVILRIRQEEGKNLRACARLLAGVDEE